MKKIILLILMIIVLSSNAIAGPPMRPVPKQVTSAEITAGTETKLRSYSPADVVSFISTHGGADAFTVKVDAAATAAYLYNAGSGAVRAGTNVTIDDDGDYITINASLAGGAVDTEGTLNADEIAVMHDLDTIKSLTEAEFKTAYNMEAGTDYLAPINGNDPVLAFDETDGTDWELRVDDTGNSFEIGSSQGGIGDNVELEIDEDGDIHVTGDAYVEGALVEVGGTDPIYRFDETDGTDWEIRIDDTGNSLEIGSSAGGVGDNVELEIDEDGDIHITKDVIAGGDVTATGDITVTGDDIFATTNTAGYIWIGDDTNYNPVAVSGHATLASDGTVAVVDFGLTTDADVGDFNITSVDRLEGIDSNVYIDLGTDAWVTIAADTSIYLSSPNIQHYVSSNDGNPEYKIGAAAAEEAIIQAVYDSGAQTLDYLLISTETADATADEGRIVVQVDEQQVLQIDDNGLEIGANGVDGTLKLYSEQGGTDYVVTFSPHATMTADTAYLLPAVKGTDNQYLKISSQATGQLIWDDPPGTGTVTQVGNDDGGGEVFTEASLAPTGGDGLYFEGTSSNTNEIYLTSVNPDGDYTITLPGETGTVMLGPAGLGTDNILAKMDGTGNLMQATGIVVDDSNNVSSVGTLGTTGDISIVAADPDLILDDSDGADGLIQIAATDADDSVMTLAVDDSGGDDQGYIELDGVNETVDILQNATFAGTVEITGAVTLGSTISDGTATLNAGALSGVTTLGIGDAITLSDGATIDQSANNYVEITENSDNIQFGFGGTDVDLIWSDGALNIRNNEDSVDAIVEIEGKDAGEKGVLRVLSDGDDKYITAYHDDTDSWVASSSGDIILAPDGDVDDYALLSTDTNVTSFSVTGGTGTLGTTSNEWNAIYLNDSSVIYGQADQSNTITSSATGWALNLGLFMGDDQAIRFGGAATDWYADFDDSVDDQMLWHTTATAAVATTDPMFEILVDFGTANGTGMTADQQVFGVAKGTQASNVALLTLDEDGDFTVNGSITSTASGQDSYVELSSNASSVESSNRLYFVANELHCSEAGDDDVILTQDDGATLTGTTWSFASVTNMILPTTAADASGEISMSTGNQLKWHDGTKVVTIDTTPTNDDYVLKYDNATATFTLEADETGGTPTINSVGDATAASDIVFDATAETLLWQFTSAYTTGPQFLIQQVTGNPTGGTLLEVRGADSDSGVLEVGDGTNVWTVSTAGLLTNAGTATLNLAAASDLTIGGGQIDYDDMAGSGNISTSGSITGGTVTDGTVTLAGDGTITGLSAGGLPDNTVNSADINTIVDSIAWNAAGMNVDGTQCADPSAVQINSGPYQHTIICADNDGSTMYGHVVMPDSWNGGTVTFEGEYLQTAADTNALNSDVAMQCRGAGETVNNTWGTEQALDDAGVTGSNAVDHTTTAAITPDGTCAAGDTLYWRWQLDATGTTTAVATLHFLGAKIEYTSNVGD